MKPLIVLLLVFCIALLIVRAISGKYDIAFSGRIAMSCMLVFSAIGHFAFTKGMSLMMPQFIPFKLQIVYLTGVLEIIFAAGLLLPDFQVLTAWVLVVFLILVLPANIYASIKNVNYQKATFDGNGLAYLWFRIPLQFLFISWIYLSAMI